ncbi:eukaryotic translation initiation factor 2B delta subunit [Fomitiporia mediterranea MF3/22]|uniref:eukaryotic translation initiation factor 2B delta subunit n=1 Tax=Fomitiporia mediterranea (strain MF3/22) TaxID=694068 RepID=UPI00044075C9|nr:eukaryotic translation initiation factor 2B delta subunit [Fomitiporia mediterranea MF3/22]EJD00890.1 eukaryotic translation initiation factor 2B delta subunit [Fomitiporia mediterranea MF3/22]
MTKAQRRELQESQRAAKAAAAAQGGEKGGPKGKGTAKPGGVQASVPNTPGRPRRPTESGDTPTRSVFGQARGPGRDARDSTHGEDTGLSTRGLRIFAHFGLPKAPSNVKGDIHPAIVRLGLQFSSFKLTGANARCIATLTAFKTVIQDYSTPPNTTLSRHLMTHLNPQINHLVSARPMAVTMGNAIRQLKLEISGSDIDMPEQDAKDLLCRKIDNYIRDRIIIADQVIQDSAGQKIRDGDVILTFARSSAVEKVLLRAHEDGKRISVIVVDSRPMLEGKHLLSVLTAADIPCTYLLLPALGSVISQASIVLLGAHSLHADGAVYARSGNALVAMLAKAHGVPVLVCCETYKFAESVILDGFTKNELAPAGDIFQTFPRVIPRERLTLEPSPNLEIRNPLYDLTPPANITAVVTEVGIIPPNSISSIPLTLGRQTI